MGLEMAGMSFKEMAGSVAYIAQTYGPIGVVIHYVISFSALGLIYALVYANRDSVLAYVPEQIMGWKIPQTGTDFVIAWALHKATIPVRVPLTPTLVPMGAKVVSLTLSQYYCY